MTTSSNDTISPDGYAVVFFKDDETPQVCDAYSQDGGVLYNGRLRAIYPEVDKAAEAFKRWPNSIASFRYGIIPVRQLIEEQPRFVLRDNATAD